MHIDLKDVFYCILTTLEKPLKHSGIKDIHFKIYYETETFFQRNTMRFFQHLFENESVLFGYSFKTVSIMVLIQLQYIQYLTIKNTSVIKMSV